MAETIHLLGGYADGLTFTAESAPRRWHIPVPVTPVIGYWADSEPLTESSVLGDYDEYAPALDTYGLPWRNDRGELIYRLAHTIRGGKPNLKKAI